ncbi:MAG: CvpA family protein [Candidatus Velthaea sp.]
MTWPDIVIGGIALVFALKGFKRGFVAELAGAVALSVAILAAFWYGGALDDAAERLTHTGAGSAHVIGMVVYAAAVYLAVVAAAALLGRFARLPVINLGNAAAGAAVGAVKALVGCWAILYVALFFPLSGDLRADLHRSTLVALVTGPNERVDGVLRGAMPWFVRPFVGPLFSHHRV